MKVYLGNETFNDRLCIAQATDLNLCNDCSCEEILAPFCWNSIPVENYADLLKLFFVKLKPGGTLIIGGYDVIEFCKGVLQDLIDPNARNDMIKNSQNFSSLSEVTSILEMFGFKVINRTLQGFHFTIEATT